MWVWLSKGHMAASYGRSVSERPATTTDSSDEDCTLTETSSSTTISDTQSTSAPLSLLDRLKAPKKSELTRKRKVFLNPHDGKRRKHQSSSSHPKSVSPMQRVREYANECLTVSAGKLFCEACREEVGLKCNIVKNHIGSTKHAKMKLSVTNRKGKDEDILMFEEI